MASQDDLTLLKEMYQRGEISNEQYDVLRRHVLWGTPLPQLIDEVPVPRAVPAPPAPYRPKGEPPAAYRAGGAPAYHPLGEPGAGRTPTAYRPGGEPPTPGRASTAYRREGEPRGAGRTPTAYRSDGEPPVGYRPDGEPSPYRPDGDTPGLGRGASGHRPEPGAVAAAPVPRRRRDTGETPTVRNRPDRPPRPVARRGRGLFAAVTSLLLALALIAAGVWWFALRETGVDARTYARSICGSVRDWQREVDASSSALVKAIPREEDRTRVRSAVQRYYTDLATRTDGLRTAIDAAGPVDVPGGRAYADSLTAAVGDQSAALRGLAARAGRLDVGAATVFQISLQTLLTGAETAVSEITAALARPAAGTPAGLRLALSDEPACAPYVG